MGGTYDMDQRATSYMALFNCLQETDSIDCTFKNDSSTVLTTGPTLGPSLSNSFAFVLPYHEALKYQNQSGSNRFHTVHISNDYYSGNM
jgi:hypothetical protein